VTDDPSDPAERGTRRRSQMPIADHLREFRSRLTKAALAILLGTVAGYVVFPSSVDLLLQPYCEAVGRGADCELIVLGPLDPFFVRVRSAFVAGIVIGAPVLLCQMWRFVRPGLTRRERRSVRCRSSCSARSCSRPGSCSRRGSSRAASASCSTSGGAPSARCSAHGSISRSCSRWGSRSARVRAPTRAHVPRADRARSPRRACAASAGTRS
jgi:hypothetical protein